MNNLKLKQIEWQEVELNKWVGYVNEIWLFLIFKFKFGENDPLFVVKFPAGPAIHSLETLPDAQRYCQTMPAELILDRLFYDCGSSEGKSCEG